MPDSPPPSTPRQTWQPPSAEELQALLPQYEITALLGRGGMGAVYKGRQIALDRPVAIKILSNLLDEADASFAERFKNEARAMGRIMHPGVVAVFDFGETADGLLYIVMEFVEGTDVSRMLARQKQLPAEHALAITAHVLDALAYAHARGIIHRDIKPANIMVGYDGVVKVADFGLAKMSQDGHSGLTQSGTAMGTLHYMAPESLMLGTLVDHRADIYAVGVMLYQMLTGKLPQGMFELPSLQIPGLDPRYDGIIATALRDDRELRYQSASEMRQELDAILTQPVAKVEAEATHAPAALPTTARPQPGSKQQPSRPPPPAKSAPAPASSKSSALLWVALLVLAVFGGLAWLVFGPTLRRGGARPPAGEPASAKVANPDSQSSAVTKETLFINTLGMKFVPVPDSGVLFCIHEVRYKDYAAYAAEAQGVDDSWKDQTCDGYTLTERTEDHPVMKVSWEDAQKFCAWLSKKEGKIYRLPTDREWSYAVGIGQEEKWESDTTPATVTKNQTEFPWGNQWPPPEGGGNFSDDSRKAKAPRGDAQYLIGYDDGFPSTAPVMSFKPNKFGLFDMGGNVWEWCEDWYDKTQKDRVLRGGAWGNGVRGNLLLSYRAHYPPGHRHFNHGFRLVVAVPGSVSDSVSPNSTSAAPPLTAPSPSPASATKEQPFVNSLGMKFVPVPGTEVLFCIHETRYKDYAAYADEVQGVDSAWKDQAADGYTPTDNKEQHPVMKVSWEDAQKFCAWLSQKEGKTYRLPTDREWSMAVGIGHSERWDAATTPSTVFKDPNEFPWGTQWPPPKGAGNYSDESRKLKSPRDGASFLADYDDGYPTTAPVMSFKPNLFGLYDLDGNAREWVQDLWDKGENDRVLRGGSLVSHDRINLLSSRRNHTQPRNSGHYDGFRIILVSGTPPDSVSDSTSSQTPSKPLPVVQSPRPATATKEQPFVNSLGMKFVPVPGTEVLFCIHETRYKDYMAYAAEAQGVDEAWKDQSAGAFTPRDSENLPVVRVSWEDVQKFCAWLSKKEGKLYRLPSDREWSFAVGIGPEENWQANTTPATVVKDQNRFPWGTEWPPPSGSGNYSDASRNAKAPSAAAHYLQGYNDGFPAMAPVMSFKPNILGLYDLGGNVWEWVDDWHDNSRQNHVLRGGSWRASNRDHLLSSYRARGSPGVHDFNFGFRLVLVQEPPTAPVSALPTNSFTRNAAATKEQPFVNTLGMKFVPVTGTDVLFCIHETRRQDYAAYAAVTSGVNDAWKKQMRHGIPCGDKDDHPVCGINWDDAKKFCAWLSKKEGTSYRLPTDEEWSIAVGVAGMEKRIQSTTPEELAAVELDHYPWGSEPVLRTADKPGNYQDIVWKEISADMPTTGKYLRDGFLTSAPVMSFRPNAFGLYDLGGNVWEWVEDGWNTELNERVLRGGSFLDYNPAYLRSSGRPHHPPGYRSAPFGFRVVLVPAK